MKCTKKIFSLLLTLLLLLLTTVPTAFATATPDEAVPQSKKDVIVQTSANTELADTSAAIDVVSGQWYYTAIYTNRVGSFTMPEGYYATKPGTTVSFQSNVVSPRSGKTLFYAGSDFDSIRLSSVNPASSTSYKFSNTRDAYCIQPGVELGSQSIKGQGENASSYASLSSQVKTAIELTMYYGLPGQGLSSTAGNVLEQQAATQAVMWEFIENMRNSTIDKSQPDESFYGKTSNSLAASVIVPNSSIKTQYDNIANGLLRHYKVPSFMGLTQSNASTVTLSYDGSKYTATITDVNEVLTDKLSHANPVSFTNTDTLSFKVDGQKLTITSTEPITNAVTVKGQKTFKAAKNTGKIVTFDDSSGTQDLISGVGITPDPIDCYLKIKTANDTGDLELQKSSSNPTITDGNDCYSLEGAVYEVYDTAGNSAGTITTDENGVGKLTGLKVGEYTVKEITAPKGYALDTKTHNVTVEAGKTATLEVSDVPQNDPIYILLKKTDSNTGTGLENAEFTIRYYDDFYSTEEELKEVNPDRNWIFKTDEDGFCYFGDEWLVSGDEFYYSLAGDISIPLGTITIQETKAPTGYIIDDTLFIRQITSEGQTESVFTYNAPEIPNTQIKGSLKIVKTSEDDEIEGIWFEVSRGFPLGTYQTDENGVILIEDLEVYDSDGNLIEYTVTELGKRVGNSFEIPDKYVTPLSKTITLLNNEPLTIAFENKLKKGSLKIVKTSEDDEIEGIWFKVSRGYPLGTYQTDKNGEILIEGLDIYDSDGNLIEYTVTELGKRVGNSYELPNKYTTLKPKTVTLLNNEVVTAAFNNKLKKGSVTLYKQDQNGQNLDGAEFELYSSDGTKLSFVYTGGGAYIYNTAGTTSTLKTSNGLIKVSQLPQGDYYFKETKAPDGYIPYGDKITFTISPENSDTLNPIKTVKDNKILLFNTGNIGNGIFYMVAGVTALLAVALFLCLFIKKRKDSKKMKKASSIIVSLALAILTIFSVAVPTFASEAPLDTTQKVSFSVACEKQGYEFSVYKVADLESVTTPQYEIKYNSLVPEISDSILNGDTATMLTALDAVTQLPVEAVGTYNSTTESKKEFTELTQGVYYVRATNYPAGVKSVTNSVFALPHYNNGWVYEIDEINLAQKVNDDVPQIIKTITNSTKNNVNYTDVSLGETVDFEIKSTTAGSNQIKIKECVITDEMSAGLTLDKTSFTVALQDQYGKELYKLDNENYTVDVLSEAEGKATTFTVSITPDYLSGSEFYESLYVSVTYSATLNKYSVTGFDGNPNTVKTLKYTNKNNVSAEIEGNTVYVYTYGVLLTKYSELGEKLQGAEFELYTTEQNAKDEENAIAKGTSDSEGKTAFLNNANEEIKLASGTYYIKETKAPSGYNRYTDVIPVEIEAKYGNTFTNGTYLTSAPENGVATVEVKNSKTLLPQTGGAAAYIFYAIASGALLASIILFTVRRKVKN